MIVVQALAVALLVALPGRSRAVTVPAGPLSSMQIMHRLMLDQEGKYWMFWTPRDTDVLFEVQVATAGYVGLGFSPNGGMKNADIIIGWVTDDEQVMLQDRFATGYSMPQIDQSQDVKLLGGYQNSSHTVLRFSRPWNTCDQEEDLAITSDTVRIIWAYGTADPPNEMRVTYHTQRGTKSLYLQEPQFSLPQFTSDVKSWDIFAPNVSLPDDLNTLYWCRIIKIPTLPRKTHVIGYTPIIKKENMQNVHHILIYECHLPNSANYFEKWLDVDGAQCFGANMPLSWKFCSSPIVAWAIGSTGEIFPDHVGFPLDEEYGGATYFMMEVHYDNPNMKRGIVDDSGIRMFYTEKLHRYDAGILMVGHDVTPSMITPPGQEWLTIGHCSGECTKNAFPANGVKAFSAILHAHLLGRNITVRHIRNNKELPYLSRDMQYDFNFQQIRSFKEELTLLPGDGLITECGYDSTDRRVPTFGGFGTQEEMCLAFIYYYPRSDLSVCTSRPTETNLFGALGIQDVYNGGPPKGSSNDTDENGINIAEETRLANAMKASNFTNQLRKLDLAQQFRYVIVRAPEVYRNKSLYDVLTSENLWSDKDLVRRLQDTVVNGDHKADCNSRKDARGYRDKSQKITYPTFTPLPPPDDTCNPSSPGRNSNTPGTNFNAPGNNPRTPGSNSNTSGSSSTTPGSNSNTSGSSSTTPGSNSNTPVPGGRPIICLPQLPSCDPLRGTNSILGNRPSFF